jgi:hypothetical protein
VGRSCLSAPPFSSTPASGVPVPFIPGVLPSALPPAGGDVTYCEFLRTEKVLTCLLNSTDSKQFLRQSEKFCAK